MILTIKEDSVVYKLDQQYVIMKIIDYNYVYAKHTDTGEVEKININELSSKSIENQSSQITDYSLIPEEKLNEARNRLEAIKPILGFSSRRLVEKRAKEVGVSPTTLYNWMRAYESTGQLSSLASLAIKGGKGKSRLAKEQEEIIELVFKEYYLTKVQPIVQRVWEEIAIRCKRANVDVPSVASVRRRARKISEYERLKKRQGKKEVEKFEMIDSKYPDGLFPMHVIQIDHTKADVIIVDDEYRTEIGRPWITMAIDIYSRMVAGFYVSLEAPGFFATGQAIANAILPKDNLKEKFKFESAWPICGKIQFAHFDNATEFKGFDIQGIAEEYGIDLIWRPVGKARYGGHIERLLGSLSQHIHILDGNTKNKIDRKREYDAGKEATMTLNEFEGWITCLITDMYHNKIHSELKKSPLQKFDEGIFGTDTQPPKGFPPRIENEDELRINFLPKEKRTVQREGIQIDNIHYYSEVLNNWIDSYEEIRGKKFKRKFNIRRDYRDISFIWFFDPNVKTYYKIPYRNISLPRVSIWEIKAARKYLKNIENREYNEDEIFEALARLKQMAKDAKNKTKTHRKIIDRESKQAKYAKEVKLISKETAIDKQIIEESNKNEFDWFNEEISPFNGIEESSIEVKKEKEDKSIPLEQNDEFPF